MVSIHQFKPQSESLTNEGCYIIEMQNIQDDPTCSIARARVEPGVTKKLHSLRGTVERYVILEGVGEVEVGGEDQLGRGPARLPELRPVAQLPTAAFLRRLLKPRPPRSKGRQLRVPGTAQANEESMGMKLLPDRPHQRNMRSTRKAARAM